MEEPFSQGQSKIKWEECTSCNKAGIGLLLRAQVSRSMVNSNQLLIAPTGATEWTWRQILERHAEHANNAAGLEKKPMKYADQLDLMRSYALKEWAKTNIDT